ncbi:MAG: hypothetical protein ACLS85_00500 [Coprobacillus cateniformis]
MEVVIPLLMAMIIDKGTVRDMNMVVKLGIITLPLPYFFSYRRFGW